MLYDHYLIVKPWEANFKPDKACIDKATIWVRLLKLPLEYYDEVALTVIGNRVRKMIKVDMNTSCQLRGHFARICEKETCLQGKKLNEENQATTKDQNQYVEEKGLKQSMEELWQIVQKPHRQKKQKEKTVEVTKQQRAGSRFNVLANEVVITANIITNHSNQRFEMVPEVVPTGQRQTQLILKGKENAKKEKGIE
ncbi:hypothetical protein K1719_020122 [Acacia pycnantha]|nr:hypothetical protein K1719_020122 [Acacia pycnantha]